MKADVISQSSTVQASPKPKVTRTLTTPPKPKFPAVIALILGGTALTVVSVLVWNGTLPLTLQPGEITPSREHMLQQSFDTKYQMAIDLARTPAIPQGQPYTVQEGDTLQSIAEANGVSPVDIVRATPEPIDFLRPGQRVNIPTVRSKPKAVLNNPEASYLWPVAGPILTSAADRRTSLDITAAAGTPVVAVQAGTVIVSGQKYNGYGNMVDILHKDGIITRYAHGSKLLVKPGQAVVQGQQIMSVGTTGLTRTPHVRFEVRTDREILDPMSILP